MLLEAVAQRARQTRRTKSGTDSFLPLTNRLNGRPLYGDRTPPRTEAARVPFGHTAKLLGADRTERRCGVGFGLCAALNGLAEQFLDVVSGLDFEMPEVLIGGKDEALNRTFQRTSRTCGQHRQRFAWRLWGRARSRTRSCRLKAGSCHVASLHHPARN